MAGYSTESNKTDDLFFPGKIAVITSPASVSYDVFHSADRLIAKYGAGKIVKATWPENFIAGKNKMIETFAALAEDREIRAFIINHAVPGTAAAVDKLKEIRDDTFIVYCMIYEPVYETAMRANLIFEPNELTMGSAMVKQAKKQGAKTFVHYSFPRHLSLVTILGRRDMIRKTCSEEGIQFVDAAAPDPVGEAGIASARQFILEDVPKLAARYGEDTAFFNTSCQMQVPLIKSVVDCHAIYPQPCCPSPFHGFPEALGIKTDDGFADLNHVIGEACRIAEEKNMTDRLSTWPVSASMMFANAGAEYAIKWINGQAPKTGIDEIALKDCMSAYVKEVVGEGVEVEMTSYSENGITYDNFKLLLMSYLDL